ncbi:Leucoanthocyanidin reductase [Perkinsus chesapeaki]|uniref:Leucoanthocyanidin reductase n=1 Tax=Perkinsus chesapeaki TaxID=330153 RepID=A0A7J6L5D4_PERCH|nr:Leucoanthocyanidin reductase [Perkinsus chesapeaki]
MSSKGVAVVGATGLFGKEISLSLLKFGHKVAAFTRNIDDKKSIIEELQKAGATVVEIPDYTDETAVANAFRGHKVDTVICAASGTAHILKDVQGHIIDAAVKSGTVERFCPDEFGLHTGATPWGISEMIDAKKEMQEKVRNSGLKWTCILVAGLFSYFLPSLKRKGGFVESYGNVDVISHNNSLEDAGLMIALAATDDRTVNKNVQFQYNPVVTF